MADTRVVITAEANQAVREFDRLRAEASGSLRQLAAVGDMVAGVMKSIGAGLGVSQIISVTDEYTKFTAQLKLATQSQREYNVAYGDVKRIAKDSQQALAATGVLYARIAKGTQELGTNQKEVAAITETVNLALKASGATTTEAASAQLQLSQAFASGTLRGEEFNAVNEAAPRLMKALADGMGLPVGALKEMASEGKITSKIMADVLPLSLEKLRVEAAQVQTIGGAFTVLKNNVMEFTGVQAQASGTVSVLTGGIESLASNLGLVAGAIATVTAAKLSTWLATLVTDTYSAVAAKRALTTVTLSTAVATTEANAASAAATMAAARADVVAAASAASLAAARVAELRTAVLAAEGEVALAIATNGLIPAQARAIALEEARVVSLSALAIAANGATAATVAATAATTSQAAAFGVAARGAGVLRGAVAMLGGPIGFVVTLLGAAATAWMVWGNKSKEAADQAKESALESSAVIIKSLDEQIARNERLIAMRKQGATLDQANKNEKATATLGDLGKQVVAIDRGEGEYAGMSKDGKFFAREKVLGAILDLTNKINLAETTGAAATALTMAEARSKFMKDYATKAEKLNEKLAEGRKLLGAAFTAADEARIRKSFATVDQGAKQEQSAYRTLMTSIEERISANKLEAAGYATLSDAQKMAIKLDAEIATGKNKLTAGSIADARAKIALVAVGDAELVSAKSVKQAVQQLDDERVAAYAGTMAEVAANEELVAVFGKSKGQIEALTIARMEDRLAQRVTLDLDEKEVAQLEKIIDAKKRNAAAVTKLDALGDGTDVAKANELLKVMEAVDEAARAAAAGMESSFGRVGKAIGGLTTALSGYGKAQVAIAAQLAVDKSDAKGDTTKIDKANAAAASAAARAQVKSYGDMAGAAKVFFKENTAGYKLLEGTEKAFRAYEMAMAVEAMVTKLFATEAVTTAVVAGKGFESAAMIGAAAVDTTTTGVSVANSAIKATASTIAGVAKAFEQMGVYGFIGAAAIIAFMAGMGSGASGGGGAAPTTFEDRQKKQGTGTVLGDDTAKSASIANSLAIIEANSGLELNYQNSMLQALRNIESALGGAAKGIIQTTGLTGGSAFGTANESTSSFFGSDKSTTITDTGVKFSGSLGDLRNGGGRGIQYEDVTVTSDGGWFHGNSSDSKTNTKALSDAALKPFTLIFDNMGELLVSAGVKLGADSVALTAAINQIGVSFAVSTRELKGQDLVDALSAGVSVAFDQVTGAVFPQVAQFQKVGEGLGETLVRVASNYAALDSIFAASGTTFGQVGMDSIAARERLLALAGGVDKLASLSSSFNEHFLTEAERLAPVQKYVIQQLAAMGQASIDSRDEYKAALLGLAESGKLATEAGAKQYAGLLELEAAFNKAYPATEKSASAQELAQSKRELEIQLLELQGDKIGALAAKRALELESVDKSLHTMTATVAALQDLRDAQDAYDSSVSAAASAVQAAAGQYQTFVTNVTSAQQKFADAQQAIRDAYTKAVDSDKATAKAVQAEQEKITDAYVSASQKVAAAQQKVVDSFSKLGGTLADFLTSLDTTELAGASMSKRKAALEAQFAITAAQARAGDAEAGAKLPEIAKSLLTVGKDSARSEVEFARMVANVRSTISGVQVAAAAKVGGGTASNESSELEKALAEQKRWSEAVTQSGAALTKSADDLLKGYNAAVNAQQQSGAELKYWSQLAAATNVSLNSTSTAVANTGEKLIKGLFDAQGALAKAQIELTAANAIKGELELRQTTSLETFVASIKDVNTTAQGVMDSASALFAAAGNQLLAGSTEAVKAQQTAREAMVYWGDVVTKTAAGIAESVKALAAAAAAGAGNSASTGAAAGAANGAVSGAANELMVRSWYANNPQYGNAKVTDVEVRFWTDGLKNQSAADIKTSFAEAMARDHGFSTPLAVSKFATGAAFVNGVVNRPTKFNMGLMGEAGAEAIMPLTNIGGRLGVHAVSSGADNSALEALVRALLAQIAELRAEQRIGAAAGVSATKELTRLWRDLTDNGTSVKTKVVA